MGLALVIVTHDLGVVAGIADRVVVMYAGRIVEEGPADRCSRRPAIRTRAGCSASVPTRRRRAGRARRDPRQPAGSRATCRRAARSIPAARSPRTGVVRRVPELRLLDDGHRAACLFADEVSVGRAIGMSALLEVDGSGQAVPGAAGASCTRSTACRSRWAAGETLGVVGESGSGKSTVARLVVRLLEPTPASIRVDGDDIAHLSRRALRSMRRRVQIVFQDPYSSLDPRMTARAIVAEPLRIAGRTRRDRAGACPRCSRWSGSAPNTRRAIRTSCRVGSASAIGIARALVVEPELLVLDEPVTALDGSIQAQILNLLVAAPVASSGSRTCSSPTTSPSCATSPIGSR